MIIAVGEAAVGILLTIALPAYLDAEETENLSFVVPDEAVDLDPVEFSTISGERVATFECGDVPVNQVTTLRVRVSNTGREQLEFGKIEVGCRCIAAKPMNGIIEAGESGAVYIIFRPSSIGKATRVTALNFKNADRLILRTSFNVRSLFQVSPRTVDVTDGEPPTPVTIRANFPDIAGIKDVYLAETSLAEAEPVALDSKEAYIALSLEKFRAAKTSRLPVGICVKSEDTKLFSVYQVVLRRSDLLAIHPKTLVARPMGEGRKTASCFVSGSIELLNDAIDARHLICEADGQEGIAVSIDDSRRGSSKMGRLRLLIELPGRYPDSIDVAFKDSMSGNVIGEATILLR